MSGDGAPEIKSPLKGNRQHGSRQQSSPEIAGQHTGQHSDGKTIKMNQQKDGHTGEELSQKQVIGQTVEDDHEKVEPMAEKNRQHTEKQKADEAAAEILRTRIGKGDDQHSLTPGKKVTEQDHGRKKAGNGEQDAESFQP